MEAEKRRLQNILAAEKEPTAASPPKTPEAENPGAPEERFEEGEVCPQGQRKVKPRMFENGSE